MAVDSIYDFTANFMPSLTLVFFLCLGDPLTPIPGFCHHCKWLIINDQLSAVNSAEILSTFEKYRLRKSAENDSNQPNSHLRCK